MKVKITRGPHTDEVIQKCYHYILNTYRKEKQRDSVICEGIDRGTSNQGLQPRRTNRPMQKESRNE